MYLLLFLLCCACTLERNMEYALHILPFLLKPPMLGGRKKSSMEEAALSFIQVHPVIIIYIINILKIIHHIFSYVCLSNFFRGRITLHILNLRACAGVSSISAAQPRPRCRLERRSPTLISQLVTVCGCVALYQKRSSNTSREMVATTLLCVLARAPRGQCMLSTDMLTPRNPRLPGKLVVYQMISLYPFRIIP